MATAEELKLVARKAIESSRQELFELSDAIWKKPELLYEEFAAHDLLTAFLEKKGFSVERSYTGIKTAFRATYGSGRPNVCVISEYDALPEIGHACGHNLIAEAGVAAGLGLKAALSAAGAAGLKKGRVTVLGTPAEEGGGGKIRLIDNGAFQDVDVAMMIHPSTFMCLYPGYLSVEELDVTYTGKASHAAAFPWEGINALDAVVCAYNSISVLRQQMRPSWRVHGVVVEGGVKANIIPERAVFNCMVRAPNRAELKQLREKVMACFQSAAQATGCEVQVKQVSAAYENLLTNKRLAKCYGDNLAQLGVDVNWSESPTGHGATDMGNVSHVVPSIHPKYPIGSGKEFPHSKPFAGVANVQESHSTTLVFASGMACAGVDMLVDAKILEEMHAEFLANKALF